MLVRSPVGMDLRRNAPRARWAVEQLASRLRQRGELTATQSDQIRAEPWVLNNSVASLEASHFVSHVAGGPRTGPIQGQARQTSKSCRMRA